MIDFSKMKVGDKERMPANKWGAENRQVFEAAAAYAYSSGDERRPQFEVSGNDDGKGYWLTRIR